MDAWHRLARSSGPFKLTCRILSNACMSASSRGPKLGFMAALLTTMSIPPKCSMVRSTNRAIWFVSPMCASTPMASIPSDLKLSASSFTVDSRRLDNTTRAPSRPIICAMAAPMPLLAPVMMATLPLRSRLFSIPGICALNNEYTKRNGYFHDRGHRIFGLLNHELFEDDGASGPRDLDLHLFEMLMSIQ